MRHGNGLLCGSAIGLFLLCASGTSVTAAQAKLCPEASSARESSDPAIAQAAALALKVAGSLDGCLYPAKLMRYGAFDVLVTLAGAPGTLCHGCAATMSAYVFRRRPEGLALVSRFADFGEAGTNGDPGKIDQLEISKSEGFAVEHGGTFQGYTSSRLDLYVFKGGKLRHIKPTLELSASNAGAVTDASKAVTIDAAWSAGTGGPNSVVVDYKITKDGRTSSSRATWKIEGPTMSPAGGGVPPEFAEASGGG